MLRTRCRDEDIGHGRGEERNVLRMFAKDALRHLDEVVEPAHGLHCGESRDHGDDHAEYGARGAARRCAQHEDEDDESQARERPESDTAQPRTRHDAAE